MHFVNVILNIYAYRQAFKGPHSMILAIGCSIKKVNSNDNRITYKSNILKDESSIHTDRDTNISMINYKNNDYDKQQKYDIKNDGDNESDSEGVLLLYSLPSLILLQGIC